MGKTLAVRRQEFRSSSDKAEDRFSLLKGDQPISTAKAERINVEERVMEWSHPNHIHAWFVKNVMAGKNDYGVHSVSWAKLRELLSTCERVLSASHLVPEPLFASTIDDWNTRPTALRSSGKVIKNVSVAHRLLPAMSEGYDGTAKYDEAYLRAIDETRAWILSMFADRKDGVTGDIHYVNERW